MKMNKTIMEMRNERIDEDKLGDLIVKSKFRIGPKFKKIIKHSE